MAQWIITRAPKLKHAGAFKSVFILVDAGSQSGAMKLARTHFPADFGACKEYQAPKIDLALSLLPYYA